MCATLLSGNAPLLSWAVALGAITSSATRCTASRMACSSSLHWRLRSSCSKIFMFLAPSVFPSPSWGGARGGVKCQASIGSCAAPHPLPLPARGGEPTRPPCISQHWPSMEHALATVDVNGLAGEEAKVGPEQAGDQPRHLLWCTRPGDRDAPLDPGLDAILLAELGVEIGRDVAGCHVDHANVVDRPLDRHAAGDGAYCRLRGAIGDAERYAHLVEEGAD